MLKNDTGNPKTLEWIENRVILFVRTILQALQRKKHVKIAKTAERKESSQIIDTIACFKHCDDTLNVLCKPIKNLDTDELIPYKGKRGTKEMMCAQMFEEGITYPKTSCHKGRKKRGLTKIKKKNRAKCIPESPHGVVNA